MESRLGSRTARQQPGMKPGTQKAGSITKDQVRQIAEKKMPDLNAASIEAAMRTVEGTARSMGVSIVG